MECGHYITARFYSHIWIDLEVSASGRPRTSYRFKNRILYDGVGTCPFDNSCPVRCPLVRLQALILQELENTSFNELAREADSVANLVPLSSEQAEM